MELNVCLTENRSVLLNGLVELSAQRWKRLTEAAEADNISEKLGSCAAPGWAQPIHLGGRCYAAVEEAGVRIADLCTEVEESRRIVPGEKKNVLLGKDEWEELFGPARRNEIDAHVDAENSTPCFLDGSHDNLMGMIYCTECNPFFHDVFFYM